MRRLLSCLLFTLALVLGGIAPALADMTGTYLGTGGDAGTTLMLNQQGTHMTGTFFGTAEGTLEATVDGNRAEGTLDVTTTNTRYTFRGEATATGFDITLYDSTGATELHSFRNENAKVEEPQPQPVAETQYWVYDNDLQVGPLTLQQVLDRIASGESNRDTQVWTADRNEWVMIADVPELAGALPAAAPEPAPEPEPQPAPVTGNFYVHDAGTRSGPMPASDVLAGIADGSISRDALVWQAGWPEWQKIETVEAFAAAFPPLLPSDIQYFVVADGQRVGPLSEAEMRARIADQSSKGTDLAWKKGLAEWTPLSSFEEFAQALAEADVPPLPELPADEPPALPGASDTPPAVPGAEVNGTPVPDAAAVDTALKTLIDTLVRKAFGDKTEAQTLAAIACVSDLLLPIDIAFKQRLIDVGLQPDKAFQDELEASYPGINQGINDCATAGDEADGGGMSDASRTEISLDDGRALAVVGGSNQSLSAVEGGYAVTLDGTEIVLKGDILTRDGVDYTAPAFSKVLEVVSTNGKISFVADGKTVELEAAPPKAN